MWPHNAVDPSKEFTSYIRNISTLANRCNAGVVGCWRERMDRSGSGDGTKAKTKATKIPILTTQYVITCCFVGGVYPPKTISDLAQEQFRAVSSSSDGKTDFPTLPLYNDRPSGSSSVVLRTLQTIHTEDATDDDEEGDESSVEEGDERIVEEEED